MKAFEDDLYEQWREHVSQILPGLLKRNLIIKPTDKMHQQGQTPQPENDALDDAAGTTITSFCFW